MFIAALSLLVMPWTWQPPQPQHTPPLNTRYSAWEVEAREPDARALLHNPRYGAPGTRLQKNIHNTLTPKHSFHYYYSYLDKTPTTSQIVVRPYYDGCDDPGWSNNLEIYTIRDGVATLTHRYNKIGYNDTWHVARLVPNHPPFIISLEHESVYVVDMLMDHRHPRLQILEAHGETLEDKLDAFVFVSHLHEVDLDGDGVQEIAAHLAPSMFHLPDTVFLRRGENARWRMDDDPTLRSRYTAYSYVKTAQISTVNTVMRAPLILRHIVYPKIYYIASIILRRHIEEDVKMRSMRRLERYSKNNLPSYNDPSLIESFRHINTSYNKHRPYVFLGVDYTLDDGTICKKYKSARWPTWQDIAYCEPHKVARKLVASQRKWRAMIKESPKLFDREDSVRAHQRAALSMVDLLAKHGERRHLGALDEARALLIPLPGGAAYADAARERILARSSAQRP